LVRRISPGQREALLARADSATHEIRRLGPEVSAAAAYLRELRQQNHFAARAEALFRDVD
jgi:hypothetical protein